MLVGKTKRPRNVDAARAAAILYGDWGTSKAYVIGLAFAIAGYSSFWLIAAMCALTALVGFNYMIVCRHYPDGGGVYASVRHRSEILSIVGAFLLIADYIVTASISALSAFQYLGVRSTRAVCRSSDSWHWRFELLRSQAHRRIGGRSLGPDSDRGCRARRILSVPHGSGIAQPETAFRQHSAKIGKASSESFWRCPELKRSPTQRTS